MRQRVELQPGNYLLYLTTNLRYGVQITFAKSGKTLDWNPEIGSILDFAEENDIDIDFGCRAGNCGTCITAIKDGEVDYLNEPGAEPEAGSCLACISVPKGNLSIDA